MEIWKILRPDFVFLGVDLPDKDALIQFIADVFAKAGVVKSAEHLVSGLQERERMLSTGIGMGIAIPHTFSLETETPAVQLIRLGRAIEFESFDGNPVDIVLAIVVPENDTNTHLQILAGFSKLCRHSEFLTSVRTAGDVDHLLHEIKVLEETIAV